MTKKAETLNKLVLVQPGITSVSKLSATSVCTCCQLSLKCDRSSHLGLVPILHIGLVSLWFTVTLRIMSAVSGNRTRVSYVAAQHANHYMTGHHPNPDRESNPGHMCRAQHANHYTTGNHPNPGQESNLSCVQQNSMLNTTLQGCFDWVTRRRHRRWMWRKLYYDIINSLFY